MLKTLLYINEDLASSIALRYMAYLNKVVPIALYVGHVEEADEKEQTGTGWVRRAWEDGVASNGKRLVDRMLRTENIDCPLAGRPKIFVGDRETEIIYELRSGNYDLFAQGYLNTADPDSFFSFISSSLYAKAPCPILVVKNLTVSKKCALLCADSVSPEVLVEKSLPIIGASSLKIDIVYYKFKELEDLKILDREEGGSQLRETESLLAKAGQSVDGVTVITGTPEQTGDFLKEYALVASTFPGRKSMRMQTLANSLASVLLVR
ncbi:MAG TPA: hypothetical protein ENK84_01355 [Desulfobulbus sp.]|nr:hypothetical protein [Desulfobulbus sp.]HHD62987.1 hypothetical protein [Desulfobulbaceae bacterium]